MTQKWLPGSQPRVRWDDSKMTQKWLKNGVRSHFWVNFRSLWGRSARVTFESLSGHFNSFWISVELGARPLHSTSNFGTRLLIRDSQVSTKIQKGLNARGLMVHIVCSTLSALQTKIRSQKGLTHKAKETHEQHQRVFWAIQGDYRVISSKTRVLRQFASESSPERSAKSLSHSFLVVPFLSSKQRCLSYLGTKRIRKVWMSTNFFVHNLHGYQHPNSLPKGFSMWWICTMNNKVKTPFSGPPRCSFPPA